MENDRTLPPEEDVDASPAPRLPASWERYELGELLGQGGMGVVYKARDRRLDRTVAIKLIQGADPTLTIRLVREARAQARIDHPNICRVYEVGEVNGRAYIAIQFIDGEPLGRAAKNMSLDEKVGVLRDVAIAIQEAHRLGIVHRDLKPANVLVERTEDGRWVPIVMDFGLAREAKVDIGITQSGALIGTPAYMSPEQARGDIHAVDRRSDVYSLGATLYELVAGQPPITEPALAKALDEVLHRDPPAPRSLVPTLPVDIETIALKCLAKDPAQRYPSARALADDLTRYLDGEPIHGRRLSLAQRLRGIARRHRALVILGAWSLAIILVLGGWGLWSFLQTRAERERAAERVQLAERLGRDAKEIEWLLRAAYQLPLHDTRGERERIRAQMRKMAATEHELGALGDAMLHDALGRGHLALHEWNEAAVELERAGAAGLDTPELHAARGRALGELYHHALEEARRSGDRAWLAARQEELETRYLVPAVVELDQSQVGASSPGDDAEVLEALVAMYRHDHATAESRALAAADRAPWLFEARGIAAAAAYAAAVSNVDRGNYDAARPQLAHATELFARAAEVARSDASVHEGAARAWLQLAEIDNRQGRPPKAAIAGALEAIDRAIAADPALAIAYTTKAYILLLRWRARVDSGDLRPLLDQVAAAAQRAVELEPRDANAWDALGNAHVYRGTQELFSGGDGEPWWRKAQDEFARALAIRPDDPWVHNDLGVAHRWIGKAVGDRGGDPMPGFRAALASYQRATTIDPAYLYAWSNQADLQAAIAEYQSGRGIDPSTATAEAERAAEHGLALDPNFDLLFIATARAHLARYEHSRDDTALAITRAALDRAEKLRPTNQSTWFYRARAARLEANIRVRGGKNPRDAIAVARTAIARALELLPASAVAYRERAEIGLVDGGATDNPGVLLFARDDVDKAIELGARDAGVQVLGARICSALAKRGDRAAIDAGLRYLDAALARDPQAPGAAALRSELVPR